MMVRNRRSNQRMRSRSPEQMHREWLELVDTDGPFLAAPVLKRAWPQGMPLLKTLENGQQRASELRQEKAAFEAAWDEWHRVRVGSDDDKAVADATRKYREQENAWVTFVVRRLLDWREDYRLAEDDAAEAAAYDAGSPEWRDSGEPKRIAGAERYGGRRGACGGPGCGEPDRDPG